MTNIVDRVLMNEVNDSKLLVDPRKIRENPSKETQIAMDFPHTVTVMVAIVDAPFRCFG